MIKAEITTVDNDRIVMLFTCWDALTDYMEQIRGQYTGYYAVDTESTKGRIEHDNDGIDLRITRSGTSI